MGETVVSFQELELASETAEKGVGWQALCNVMDRNTLEWKVNLPKKRRYETILEDDLIYHVT